MTDKPRIYGKIRKDLGCLNVNRYVYKIADMFECQHVCHKYRDGKPCVTYRVKYDDVHYCKGKLPVSTRVCLPYSPDHTQFKYSLKPLLSYVRAYHLLCESDVLRTPYNYRLTYFIEKYFEVIKFFKHFGEICADKLKCINLYGGLCKDSYCKLAHYLKKIRCILVDGICNLDRVVLDFGEVKDEGLLVLAKEVSKPYQSFQRNNPRKPYFTTPVDFDL